MPVSSWGGYKDFVAKKLQTIIVPQISLGCITAIYGICTEVILSHRYPLSEFDFIWAFNQWFLMALFLMLIILWPIVRCVKSKMALAGVALVFMVAFILTDWNGMFLPQQTLCACFWGLPGWYSTHNLC